MPILHTGYIMPIRKASTATQVSDGSMGGNSTYPDYEPSGYAENPDNWVFL